MKILITGGGGFLSRGMIEPIVAAGHELRLMDVFDLDLPPHECLKGDVTDLDDVRRALTGVDAVIINHMAPRKPDAYETPQVCFQINVTGTANVLHAAAELGIRKIVIISTTGMKPPADYRQWVKTVPLSARSLYGATKACQETLGRQYAEEFGMTVSILRLGYIVDAEAMQDKYGRDISERAPLDCDRRDVGEVARLALERTDTSLDVFPVMSTREAQKMWGSQHTIDRLRWTPRYDFDRLPLPAGA
ncbi:NAD-dependent epimerase/dehydratase family protein [Cerasicoccus fimbriatus]|uniref:NAD-dependent epimerase/dehydratase family protein n=1 Tax=Cerasicoccus fimbriatus TaxID=3014554 RepID=UPI0022B2CA33|nr:NAD(P)-dependent oxidoreductase [Cerasicoccus sp. TK19100]